jgi:hypothetical protein
VVAPLPNWSAPSRAKSLQHPVFSHGEVRPTSLQATDRCLIYFRVYSSSLRECFSPTIQGRHGSATFSNSVCCTFKDSQSQKECPILRPPNRPTSEYTNPERPLSHLQAVSLRPRTRNFESLLQGHLAEMLHLHAAAPTELATILLKVPRGIIERTNLPRLKPATYALHRHDRTNRIRVCTNSPVSLLSNTRPKTLLPKEQTSPFTYNGNGMHGCRRPTLRCSLPHSFAPGSLGTQCMRP